MRKDLCYYTMYLVRSDLNGNVGGYREIFQQRTKRQRYLKIIGPNIMRQVRSYLQQTEFLTGAPHFVRCCFYINFHLRGTATLCSLAFSSGSVSSCFNNLCLTQPGFEHPTFRMRGERCNQLHHHCDSSLNIYIGS